MTEEEFHGFLSLSKNYVKCDQWKSDKIDESEKLLWVLANVCYNIGYHNGRQEEAILNIHAE